MKKLLISLLMLLHPANSHAQTNKYNTTMIQTKTIVFIHGLFQNPESWVKWTAYFARLGYTCYTPAYPYHEGNPAYLRKNFDPALGKLTFGQVIDSLAGFLDKLPEKPILIGHSMGGLAVQKLVEMDKAIAGICVDPAPPKGVFTLKWSFLKANISTVNPFKGNSVCIPTVKWFHYAFCNVMTMEETRQEYENFVVPESRNIPRSTTGNNGKIDFKKPHVPLLIISGEKDHIIPPVLNRKNVKAYKDKNSKIDFKIFPGRSHYICCQKGWEEVAEYCGEWIEGLKQKEASML